MSVRPITKKQREELQRMLDMAKAMKPRRRSKWEFHFGDLGTTVCVGKKHPDGGLNIVIYFASYIGMWHELNCLCHNYDAI